MARKTWGWAAPVLAALALAGCNLHEALFGFRSPTIRIAGSAPLELAYREAPGGLVIVTGRVNDAADVDFILDTGAPVTVLIDGLQTAALHLDTSKATRLGDPNDPATPMGVIQGGFAARFGNVSLTDLTALVIPGKSLPCQERVQAVNFGGVIGADLFRRFVVEVDPSIQRVRLHEPKAWRPPENTSTIPLTFEDGHVFVDAKVVLLPAGNEVSTRLNLDTGMSKAMLLVAGGSSEIPMPTKGDIRKACYVSGMREELRGPPVHLKVGESTIRIAKPTYAPRESTASVQRGGALGGDAFRGRRVFIDYPSKRLVITDLG